MKAKPRGWARRFRQAIDVVIDRMSDNPRQFPVVFKNVRRALLRRFPYSLFFVIEDNALIVIACFHASRDPSHWQKRTSAARGEDEGPLPTRVLFRRLGSMEMLTPDEIVRLTPPERLALIAQLWDSLEHEQLPLTSAQEAELERRLSSLDEDRRNGVTWASLKAELELRCP